MQRLARRLDVTAVGIDVGQPVVLDLRHVDRRVPGGEQRRSADRRRDFRRQRVHVVAEQRTLVGIGVEIQIAAGIAQLLLHRLEQIMAAVHEGIILGPHLVNDLHARIAPVGMDGDHAAAGAERAGQRRQHALGLELQRRARTIRLRGDHQIVVGHRTARLRDHLIEQELVVVAVQHQHDWPLIDRVAAFRRHLGLPVFAEERLQRRNLLLEAVRGIAVQRHFLPDHTGGGGHRLHRQPRRFGVSKIGQHDDAGRMLDETVGHFLQTEPYVFEADLFADDVERHGRKTVVHRAHHARQHSAVAEAGVEHTHRRRARMNIGELEIDAVGDLPLLAAGVDEQQIFLPVVEEAEIALRVLALDGRLRQRFHRRHRGLGCRVEQDAAARRRGAGIARHEGADALQRIGGDAAAIT